MLYIYQYPDWTKFRYQQKVTTMLGHVRMEQGRLLGVASLALNAADAETCFRSDLAASFAAESLELTDGALKVFMHASVNFLEEVSEERLCKWHAACVRGGGRFRTSESAEPGVEPERIAKELSRFLKFFNDSEMDGVLKAAIAHFWFLTIRPFEKGNKVIAGLLTDIQLSRSEGESKRFYSLFAELLNNVEKYNDALLHAQQGNGEITEWLLWFIGKMQSAMANATAAFDTRISGVRLSMTLGSVALSARQLELVEILKGAGDLESFKNPDCPGNVEAFQNNKLKNSGEVSSSEWAALAGISHDSALRDLQDMVQKGVLEKASKGGRGTRYRLKTHD